MICLACFWRVAVVGYFAAGVAALYCLASWIELACAMRGPCF